MEHARAFEPVQDDRVYTEVINAAFLFGDKGTTAEYSAGLNLAIERDDWLVMHESGTYARLEQAEADLARRTKPRLFKSGSGEGLARASVRGSLLSFLVLLKYSLPLIALYRSRCARIAVANALPSFTHVSSGRSLSRSTSTILVPANPWSSNSKHQPLPLWDSFRPGSPIKWITVSVLNIVSYSFVR